MIASENFDNINEKIEVTNPATSHDEIKKIDCAESNVKSSNSSSIPSVSSSSFNSFVNSPNTSTSSSPTNKESNTKKKFAKSNYSDPLLDFYNQSYGYYFPYNDMSNPLVNSYYEYAQMFGYPSYPTYFPVDFSQGWIPNGPKVYNGDRKKDNALSSSQKMNQNAEADGYQQRRYKKPFNRRTENQKPQEEKIVDYDLMKNEQVYVDAFPALEPNSGEKTSQQPAKQDENNSTDEAKGVNKENELKRENSVGWSGKKWSEIVNGNQMYPEYHEANGSKQMDNNESSLQKQINGLSIEDTQCNSETCSQKSERTNSKKSNYKKNNYDPNYYYNQNSQNFDYYLQQQFYNDYKNFYGPKIDIDSSIIDSLNPSEFCYAGEQEGAKDSRFFVIKSNSRDDVLHSIKHGIWCSTKYGNNKLNQAFLDKKSHASIYLFFSVNTSGMFSGMAEMTSQVDFDTKSELWTQDKWKGKFDLKWIFVKDVPNSKLKHITLPNNENKPVTHSRDAQEIPFDGGVEMLNIFKSYKHMTTLLENQADLYQADSYMYNLMFHFYAAQARYSKYHYRSSDYKWKNPSQQKGNIAASSMSDTSTDPKDCAPTYESGQAPSN